MPYTSIGNSTLVEQRIAFHKARLDQYTERTGQTRDQTIGQLIRTYGPEQNQPAVDALIDAVVDEQYQTKNKPTL